MPYVGGTVPDVLLPTAPRPPMRRGACPGVLDPMEAADGWLVRVRIPAGRISADELRLLADLADRYGSGTIEVTSRANVQLRGIPEPALEAVGAQLIDAGLTAPDAATDVRRAVVASPLAGHDPTELVDVTPVVDAVLDALADAGLPDLPAKFGITIDGGGAVSVRHVPGTVCVGAVGGPDGSVRWQLTTTLPLDAATGHALAPLGLADLAAPVLAAVGTAAPGARNRPPHEAVDPNRSDAPSASSSARNRSPGEADGAGRLAAVWTASAGQRSRRPDEAVGVLGHPVSGRVNVVAGAFLGRVDTAAIRVVAELADAGLGVRTAPGAVALLGLPTDVAAATISGLARAGFVVSASDARRGITACIGRPGCASARADTAASAAAFTRGERAARVHLAACEKRCGAPLGATVLVADERGRFARLGVPR